MIDINKILIDNYDIKAKNIKVVLGGWKNEKYLIESNNKKYLLKLYNHNKIEKMSAGEFSTDYLYNQMNNNFKILNYMNEKGLNCPKIINTNENTLYIPYDKDILALMTYIDAKNVNRENINNIQLYNLGLEARKKDELFKLCSRDVYKGNYLKLPTLETLAKKLNQNIKNINNSSSREYINLLTKQIEILNKLEQTDIMKDIPINLIHGDFADDNIIFKEDKPYIVDFELIRENSFLQDVGRIILSYGFINNTIDIDRINNFINGYQNINEKQVILSLIVVWINEVNMWIKDKYFNIDLTPKSKRFQDELIYLTNNFDQLLDAYHYSENNMNKYKRHERKLIRQMK